ncbi:MAG: citrate/2-methylcitrate synthase, partial [Verrucomicrobiia bacterium]
MPAVSKGLEGVVATTTDLSDVDGLNGRLTYAGYDINELAGKVSFEECVHLLWHGHLPNRAELAELHRELAEERELPKGVHDFVCSAPKTANPMDVLRTAVSMLGLYDSMPPEETRVPAERKKAVSITAKMGVIVGLYHRVRTARQMPPLRPDLGEAAHFLYLINGVEASHEAVRTLDCAYVLHADHGMNASTFSARVAISTLTDIFSAISAAIGTLKGPLHGGARRDRRGDDAARATGCGRRADWADRV